MRHGLLAKCIVIGNESAERFDALFTSFLERFGPLDDVEAGLVEEMAAAFWRTRRAWAIESRLLDNSLENQPAGDELRRLAAAFSESVARPELGLLHRYETRLHRIFQRSLYNLLLLRDALPDEPRMEPKLRPDESVTPIESATSCDRA